MARLEDGDILIVRMLTPTGKPLRFVWVMARPGGGRGPAQDVITSRILANRVRVTPAFKFTQPLIPTQDPAWCGGVLIAEPQPSTMRFGLMFGLLPEQSLWRILGYACSIYPTPKPDLLAVDSGGSTPSTAPVGTLSTPRVDVSLDTLRGFLYAGGDVAASRLQILDTMRGRIAQNPGGGESSSPQPLLQVLNILPVQQALQPVAGLIDLDPTREEAALRAMQFMRSSIGTAADLQMWVSSPVPAPPVFPMCPSVSPPINPSVRTALALGDYLIRTTRGAGGGFYQGDAGMALSAQWIDSPTPPRLDWPWSIYLQIIIPNADLERPEGDNVAIVDGRVSHVLVRYDVGRCWSSMRDNVTYSRIPPGTTISQLLISWTDGINPIVANGIEHQISLILQLMPSMTIMSGGGLPVTSALG